MHLERIRSWVQAPLGNRPHQMEATTWGIRLITQTHIGRARWKTEAAVNTIGDERRIGWVVIVKRRLNYRHDAYAA